MLISCSKTIVLEWGRISQNMQYLINGFSVDRKYAGRFN